MGLIDCSISKNHGFHLESEDCKWCPPKPVKIEPVVVFTHPAPTGDEWFTRGKIHYDGGPAIEYK